MLAIFKKFTLIQGFWLTRTPDISVLFETAVSERMNGIDKI